jgi:hypothetical protein
VALQGAEPDSGETSGDRLAALISVIERLSSAHGIQKIVEIVCTAVRR